MYFEHPEILWWLFLVLIPVIIHLFNFRRYKKVYFSNVALLKNVVRQTKKQNRLKHLLVLLMRMLITAFVVLAFAGPKRGVRLENLNPKVKTVYIDNSFSMMAETERGPAFEKARNIGAEIVQQSRKDTRFLILSNDFYSGKKLLSKEQALDAIDKLKISPVTSKMSQEQKRMMKILHQVKGYESFWISDFQICAFEPLQFKEDTVNHYMFLPVHLLPVKNISVDTCFFSEPVRVPGTMANLRVKITNRTAVAYEKVPVKFFLNGHLKNVQGVDLKPFKNREVEFSFIPDSAGWQYGKVMVDDYPITFDDQLFFTFNIADKIEVTDIYDQAFSPFLKVFYDSDSSFEFQTVDVRRIKSSRLMKNHLVLLDGLKYINSGFASEMIRFIEQGGNLFFIPSTSMDLQSINQFLGKFDGIRLMPLDTLSTEISYVKKEHWLFKKSIKKLPKHVELPKVKAHYPIKYSYRSGVESLLALRDGDDFLVSKKFGKGSLYILTAPLNDKITDWMYHPLFVPVMYGATLGFNENDRLFYFIGKDEKIKAPVALINGDGVVTLYQKGTDYSFIPAQRQSDEGVWLFLNDEVRAAGFYDGYEGDNFRFAMAFNYNRAESEMKFYNENELDSLLQKSRIKHFSVLAGEINNVAKVINLQTKGSQLWKLFIILALLLLLAESLVLRRWK